MNNFLVFLLSIVFPVLLSATAIQYRLCIDGGGSKTMLQVLDHRGNIVPLRSKNGDVVDRVTGSGSNINVIGHAAVHDVLQLLINDVTLQDTNISLKAVLPQCAVYAGMSGLGLESNKAIIRDMFASFGVAPENIIAMADVEMAMSFLGDNGIVLIAGTGSICFGKKNGTVFRVGGLGRVLGDEGSAYQVGYQALKAVLAEEYGWGCPTTLTPAFQKHFNTVALKTLIPGINAGTTPSSALAALAPLVCVCALAGDCVAQEIMTGIDSDLVCLVKTMLTMTSLKKAPLHCWGGLFKSSFASAIIAEIQAMAEDQGILLEITNHAHDNLPVLFALNNS